MTSIPIHYYSLDADSFSIPSILSNHEIFQGTLEGFTRFRLKDIEHVKSPDYFVSQSFSYFGAVRLPDRRSLIVIGPVFSTPASETSLKNFMREWAVQSEYRETVSEFLNCLIPISFSNFLSSLSFLELCLNDRSIDIQTHFQTEGTEKKKDFVKEHAEKVYENREYQTYHNTWDFEVKMLQYIQEGKPEQLNCLLKDASHLSGGTIADNALRQRKNILIAAIALVTRSAVRGGMDIEEAYQLSDIYIMDCERSDSIAYISDLENTMLMDFAERVEKQKIPKHMSQEIFQSIQFIRKNINEPIHTTDVADHIGRSRSWLSTAFKKEMGMNLSEYIMLCRLEEAKSLLCNSDKTLGEISAYLCFSSQSYFQNVFRKTYGITPKQYRDKSRQSL